MPCRTTQGLHLEREQPEAIVGNGQGLWETHSVVLRGWGALVLTQGHDWIV